MTTPPFRFVVQNDILHRFFSEGKYDRSKEVLHTISPSMDICISSNFERFLYHMSGNDAGYIKELMATFESTGKLRPSDELLQNCRASMDSGRATQEEVWYFSEDSLLPFL